MHQLPFNSGDFSKEDETYQRLEQVYLEKVADYSREDLGEMAKMVLMVMSMHQQEYGDFLGEIAGENELLNQRSGQFFTPFTVASFMAKMSLADAQQILEEKGIITIADPAVGGGAMLLAAAEALYQQKIDPRSAAQFDAVDKSRNAFNMTYIQLSAADLQAMVRHGNTLSNKMWECRPTPQLRYFDRELKQYRAIAKMKQLLTHPEGFFSDNAVEPLAQTVPEAVKEGDDQVLEAPVQQNLFDTENFTGAASTAGAKRKASADIILPTGAQLGLFSDGNEMK